MSEIFAYLTNKLDGGRDSLLMPVPHPFQRQYRLRGSWRR